MQTTYVVPGMTRSHCVNSVHDEVSPIPGVTEVEVSLADGSVTATADQPVDALGRGRGGRISRSRTAARPSCRVSGHP